MATNNFQLDNFQSDKNYVIEASAGTGKTYNIVEIVSKLVGSKNELTNKVVKLEDILIVTYTEKAAGELKDRIREKLPNADVDNAAIYTIHSFCQNTIKRFGKSANLPLNLNVVDKIAIENFAKRYVREDKICEDITYLYGYQQEFNVDSLIDTLVDGAQKYYLDKDYNEESKIISLTDLEDYKEIIKLKQSVFLTDTFDELLMRCPKYNYYYDILLKSNFERANKMAQDIKEKYSESFNFNGSSFQLRYFKSAPNDVIQAFNYFYDLKMRRNGIKNHKLLGAVYLKDFYVAWQKEKELNKNQTFDDMIRSVREALINDSLLKEALKKTYTYAIIDEFQDTNQKQFDIFKSIFMEDDLHKLIVVGDPKQSIYSFQGADVNVYSKAIIEIEDDHNSLSKNFRSTAKMVDSCNKFFESSAFFGSKFKPSDALQKNEPKSNFFDATYNGQETKAFWIAKDEENDVVTPEQFALIAVQQIIDCCTKVNGKTKLQIKPKEEDFRDVSFKDFTFLTKSKTEMTLVETALKNAGIPYVRYKDTQVFLGMECAHWIALLKALMTVDFTGYKRKVLKRALYTKFFGLSLEVINSKYVSKDDTEQVKQISLWRRMAENQNWKTLFDDIIVNSKLTKNMKSLKELQSLAIFKQIAKYCIEFLSSGKSLDELVRNLQNLSIGGHDDMDDSNGTIVEKSTNFDCVQIMTMHASKGLERSVVIASGGFKGEYNQIQIYQCPDDYGKNKLSFEKPEHYDDNRAAEFKRLIYVAYTRPKYILMLPYYESYTHEFLKESFVEYMNNYEDDYRIIESTKENYEVLRIKTNQILASNETKDDENTKHQFEKIAKIKKHTAEIKVSKHSYSSLHGPDIFEDDEENKEGVQPVGLSKFDKNAISVNIIYDESKEPLTLPSNYPAGSKLGTALHEIFEGLDFVNYEDGLEEKIKLTFTRQGIKFKEEWLEPTKNMVRNVLNAKLPLIKGSNIMDDFLKLKGISFDNKLDEVEFNFNIHKTSLKDYCNGFVDLIFKNGDYYSVLDWKSDRLNEQFINYCSTNSIKSHVDSCYSIQRTLYSYCLIKWLQSIMPNKTCEEIFEQHFGGVYYVFLRGCINDSYNGIYAQTWKSWDELKASFDYIVKLKVGGSIDD